MSRYFEDSVALSTKYAVGEIVDMVGVPNMYEDGKYTWMRTGTWIDATEVPDVVIDNIKQSASNLTALSNNSLIDESYAYIPGLLPPAIVETTRCFPYSSNTKGTSAFAFVVNANGPSIRAIGQTCGYESVKTNGGGNAILSDGTKFWSFTSNADGNAFTAKSSVDGITWTSETLSGQATFAGLQNSPINMGGVQTANNYAFGEMFKGVTSVIIAVWCGARFLLIGINTSYLVAQRSTNGTSFGGDETAAILGSTTTVPDNYWWSYRNGLNFFIAIGKLVRKSSDGGVTWATATNDIGASGEVGYKVNSTDPARILATKHSQAACAISTDSGQTWTARAYPVIPNSTSIVYGRGTKWVFHTGTGATYVSNDDCATWSISVTLPALAGPISGIYADTTRWYALSLISNQIATSTDFATWTIRNIKNTGLIAAHIPRSLASTDVNHVALCYQGTILYSTDGGVTWQWAMGSSGVTNTGSDVYQIIPCNTGTDMFISGTTASYGNTYGLYITESDLDNGGKAVRSTTAAVAPLRTNAIAYARVS